MGTIVVTGATSGIGAATRRHLERDGHRVIGVDLRASDVVADLASVAGREAALAAIRDSAAGGLDGVVVCAGIGPQVADAPPIVSVNYFGAVAMLDGCRDLLAASRGAAVAVSSNSATLPGSDNEICRACADGDEPAARAHAATLGGQPAYAGSKLALARWVRRQAVGPDWAGAGIRLNAVAPGAVMTPLLQEGLDHPIFGDAIRGFPIPAGGFGRVEDIAAAIAFLLGPAARFCVGSVLFVDGGTDALLRPDEL
jgi:NAD(P)-dependent dehydrogenase (short-subunit alcohol dehydrogenase family)